MKMHLLYDGFFSFAVVRQNMSDKLLFICLIPFDEMYQLNIS